MELPDPLHTNAAPPRRYARARMTEACTEWDLPREEAVPRLLELQGDRLYGLARRFCGNPDEAQDLVQEVFVQAWRKWDQFGGRSDPIVWLYTIARRACQRMHRRRAGEPDHFEHLDEPGAFAEAEVAVVPSGTDPFDEEVRREQREAVGAAITALPDDFRMPLVLKEIVGLPVADVARILDLKEGTVKTRLHRARLRLRDALAEGLPKAALPPPAYTKQVCLDLLKAKQDSLDRGVEMPDAEGIICERCQAVFSTLDLAQDVCGRLGEEGMPAEVRALLDRELRQAT